MVEECRAEGGAAHCDTREGRRGTEAVGAAVDAVAAGKACSAMQMMHLGRSCVHLFAVSCTCRMHQVTSLVIETEAKVTRTSKLMDEQGVILEDFKTDLENVKATIQSLESSGSVGLFDFPRCTTYDLCCWTYIALSCCVFFVCILLAIQKWESELGITIASGILIQK